MAVSPGAPSPRATHTVDNQVPDLGDGNSYTADPALQGLVAHFGGGWHASDLEAWGAHCGQQRVREAGLVANQSAPRLEAFDRRGHRVNRVAYHPAYHDFMRASMAAGLHCLPWEAQRPGATVARCAMTYQVSGVEPGHGCPITMTFAVVPALRHDPKLAATWVPRVTGRTYDSADRPAPDKTACTMGMAMTEKQGGSDVRQNQTRAVYRGEDAQGSVYALTGHKWFCSAPMSDAFLTLAHTDRGLTCFLVPRWRPDGTKNAMHLQRLKDKLGNRSNASAEIEYDEAWAVRLGDEGRGVPTIIDMVGHTRLDCVLGSAGLLRRAVTEAVHHSRHRKAFGARLVDHTLMQNVLADLAVESEASIALGMRLAAAFDAAQAGDAQEAAFARAATAIGKYLVCKRVPGAVFEAMECLGGNGYIEASHLPLFYREAPVNSIWEGSGNVMCLDVLRALHREPASLEAVFAELATVQGHDDRLDATVASARRLLERPDALPFAARRLVETLGLALQAAVLLRTAPPAVADLFLASRLGGDRLGCFGTLRPGVDAASMLERALPSG